MFSTDQENIEQLQSDILLESLANNQYFKKSSITSKNKALNTTSKYMVGAVNEILKNFNSLNSSTLSTLSTAYSAIGDILSNPGLLEKLHEIDENIILALYKVNNDVIEVRESLSLDTASNKTIRNYTQIIQVGEETQNNFVLDYKPVSNILFYVNGVFYNKDIAYSYDEESNSITWLYSEQENEFQIKNSLVSIVYDYKTGNV
jgi:hypothetical protein